MTVKIKKGITQKERQKLILSLEEKRRKRTIRAKKAIMKETFGSVSFDETKSPLEIQKELRDEWG